MSDHREPPWRRQQAQQGRQRPAQTVPRKRQADEQEDAWVAGEDRFVLQQAKKKAEIRVKEGRPKPIDLLAIILRFIDTTRNDLEDDFDASDFEVANPEGVFDALDAGQLDELHRDIKTFLRLELDDKNLEFWETMRIICEDRRQKLQGQGRAGRGINAVASDVDKLLAPKSLNELQALENQIRTKLQSDEDIDVDYWEHLLRSLLSWKARAKLRQVSQSIIDNQRRGHRAQEAQQAEILQKQLTPALALTASGSLDAHAEGDLDPDAMLRLSAEDKSLALKQEQIFLSQVVR